MIKKDLMAAYQSKHEHETLKKRVMSFKRQLMRFCDTLDEPFPQYTGWFVLLKKSGRSGDRWEFLGFYNPDTAEENTEPEWDLCLPIPKPESVEEHQGW